ncbi:hypothetical protein CYY_007346 [Polysphondylium violaceum]|uniref:Kynureninase n=1 Tax=Polysphondylium violaceum TaxID=133409 RepID=A0A8J4PPU5_9MYCE|nr:hypothetical protein CYY_007346 [Polysphondylium violaceum]
MENFLNYIKQHDLDINDETLAEKLDALDDLSHMRKEFNFPQLGDIATEINDENRDKVDQEVIYLTGNSLGLQGKAVERELKVYLDDWKKYAVEGHMKGTHPFISIDEEIQSRLASIVGAKPSEVCSMNSLSVNLHILLSNFYKPTKDRYKIVIEYGAFPSDLYVTESQLRNHGFNPETDLIKIKPKENEYTLTTQEIIDTLKEHGDSIAVVLLSGVQYFTGQFFDIKTITKVGHECGAIVGWDLAHAAGNVQLQLHDWDVDFASWCSYKYLNSGPGCIAGVFVHSRITETFDLATDNRLMGWFGNKLSHRFHKEKPFVAETGALGFRCSNPSVADTTALRASLDIFEKAGGVSKLSAKSVILTGYLEYLLRNKLASTNIQMITPTDPSQRGAQISLLVREIKANEIKHKLLNSGVICDVREPDVIRVAPAPLYNSFTDCHRFIQLLNKAMM